MSYYGGGQQNGGTGRVGGGGNGQQGQGGLLSGPPQHQQQQQAPHQQHQHQLFVNPNQIQFSTATQNFTFPGPGDQGGQLQLNTGGAPLLLQPLPGQNFVTDQLGLGQLITQAAAQAQSQHNLQNIMSLGSVLAPSIQIQQEQQAAAGPQQSKQRVFTGTVTKIHDNFGFIDEEVFFQMGVVKGPVLPKEGDRVLVEADFNPSMPFKWNATRVQIVNMGGGMGASHAQQAHQQGHQQQQSHQQQSGYQQQLLNFPTSMASGQKGHPVPPPPTISNMNSGRSSHQSSVSIVSNPHSIYSSGASRPSTHVALPESHHSNRRPQSHTSHLAPEPPLISQPSPNLPSLLQMERERERQREEPPPRDNRKDREVVDRGGRDRSKERPRERERERRGERRSRSRSREIKEKRRVRSSTPPKQRRPRDQKDPDRGKGRVARDRSPASPPSSALKALPDRQAGRRSRSRDTVKSSESKSTSNNNDRGRSLTPSRRKLPSSVKPPPRYSVEIPKFPLDLMQLDIIEMKRRYPNLYVPSDFFLAKSCWMETFPLVEPLELGKPSPVHIFGRHVQRIQVEEIEGAQDGCKEIPNVLEAPDSSCTFKVKVMILSSGSMEQIYKKSGCSSESSEDKEGLHPLQRLLSFVVGVKTGKQEVMALGGAWSPSLDGLNPHSDPQVLINTAIRTVKSLCSLDLTRCKFWYRFMELYYRRSNGTLETTVYFLPDLSSLLPTDAEWMAIKNATRMVLHGKEQVTKKVNPPATNSVPNLNKGSENKAERKGSSVDEDGGVGEVANLANSRPEQEEDREEVKEPVGATTTTDSVQAEEEEFSRMEVVDECNGDEQETVVREPPQQQPLPNEAPKLDTSFDIYDDIVEVAGEVMSPNKTALVQEVTPTKAKEEQAPHRGTHFSILDPKNLNVAKLREELSVRNLSTKGLKSQLTIRLVKALKDEEEVDAKALEGKEIEGSQANQPPQPDSKEAVVVEAESEEVLPCIQLVDPSKILEESVDESSDPITPMEGKAVDKMEEGEIKEEEQRDEKKGLKRRRNKEDGIIKAGMSSDEKAVWERRYALPKTPKVLIYPSASLKGGIFDCSSMTLSSLRDYRLVDRKEESFEVSLFSELFYEMLSRDFAFRIYREIVERAAMVKDKSSDQHGKEEDAEKGSKSSKDAAGPPSNKKRKMSTTSSALTTDSTEKQTTVHPFLLLSFLFFDQTQCGYIMEIDLEEICAALGLGLTRSQLRKKIGKVVTKGSLHYRKWTDKSEAEGLQDTNTNNKDNESEIIRQLSQGNKALLPVFTYSSKDVDCGRFGLAQSNKEQEAQSVLITVDGQLVDVRQMKDQLEKAEKHRLAAEANANVLKNSLNEAKNQLSELKKSSETLKDNLSKTKESLKKLESCDKSNKDDLEVFRRSTERFLDRVKDIIKLPVALKDKEKETKEKLTPLVEKVE